MISLFSEHLHDREVVAEYAHSFFRRLTSFRDFGGGRVAFANRGEHFELDCGFQSLGALVRVYGLEK